MTLAIIDYGSGNLRSVAKAFEHVAGDKKIVVTSKAGDLAAASHIVLPGVGAYGDCMKGLQALPGMLDALNECVLEKKSYFLGICVGMQMMFERGLEHGTHAGLGWLKGEVVRIQDSGFGMQAANTLKIPHMGWNELAIRREHPLLKGIAPAEHVYFVHSYHAVAQDVDMIATTEYGHSLVAIAGRDNMVGTQFHPEKSQSAGLAMLRNFLYWN